MYCANPATFQVIIIVIIVVDEVVVVAVVTLPRCRAGCQAWASGQDTSDKHAHSNLMRRLVTP